MFEKGRVHRGELARLIATRICGRSFGEWLDWLSCDRAVQPIHWILRNSVPFQSVVRICRFVRNRFEIGYEAVDAVLDVIKISFNDGD